MPLPNSILMVLDEQGVNDTFAGKALSQIIKGETVKEVFDGDGELVQRTVLRRPDDVARGLVLYDTLNGGKLGLTPKQMDAGNAIEAMYAQFAPVVDDRIVPSRRISEQMGSEKIVIRSETTSVDPPKKEGGDLGPQDDETF